MNDSRHLGESHEPGSYLTQKSKEEKNYLHLVFGKKIKPIMYVCVCVVLVIINIMYKISDI